MDVPHSIQAHIFDLDGTLVDVHKDYIHTVFRRALATFGREVTEQQTYRLWYGHDRDNIVQYELGIDPLAFWQVFKSMDPLESRLGNIYPYKDALTVLPLLKQYKLGVVTSSPRYIAEGELNLLGCRFDVIITGDDVRTLKPHPEGMALCLARLGVPARSAVLWGNGTEDIMAAQRMGIYAVHVRRDHHPALEAEPALVVDSLIEGYRFFTTKKA
jgi:HAD superfamily hydrolase (TIGR01509 family)